MNFLRRTYPVQQPCSPSTNPAFIDGQGSSNQRSRWHGSLFLLETFRNIYASLQIENMFKVAAITLIS